MLTATQFWTEARREELREWKARGYFPSRLKRFKDSTNSGGTPIEKGPHAGFRFHEAWPSGMNYMEAKRNGDNEALRCLDNHGWYTDSFQSGVVYACAVEVRIPRRRAKAEGAIEEDYGNVGRFDNYSRVRWMEATAHSDWDQILISRRSSDLHDTLKDCIRSADRVAERSAEEDREADAKDQAEQQIQMRREEVEKYKSFLRDLITEIRLIQKCPGGAGLTTFEILKDRVCSELSAIRKARKRIALLESEPWHAVA